MLQSSLMFLLTHRLVDTIAKLPDDYKLTLLNYLRSVEDIYENRSA